MRTPSKLFPRLLWFAMPVVVIGVMAVGLFTNITLRSIERNLPNTLLKELTDLSIVLENLSDTVAAARAARERPDLDDLDLLRKRIAIVYRGTVALRESYVFDNLVQASAFHAVVAPAISDAMIWLSKGVSGYGPDSEIAVAITLSRLDAAYQKARLLNHESRLKAQETLDVQRRRLDRFLGGANLLFVLTALIAFGTVYLLFRQQTLRRSEAQIQAQMRRQRDLLNSLFDHIPLGITVWDADHHLLHANKGFSEITGYKVDEASTLDVWFARACPDTGTRERVATAWRTLSGSPHDQWEFGVTCADGRVKDIAFHAAFLSDGRVLVTMADITERKQHESALRESEEKYRTILENITEGYYEVDLSGNLTFFNDSACQMIGYPREELIGRNNRLFMDEVNRRKVFKAFNRVYASGLPHRAFDWVLIRKDGTEVHIETSVSLMKNPAGEPIGFRGIARDVTERKRMEAEKTRLERQLQQAQKIESIGMLAGGIAHDFNNILSSILGYTELALCDVPKGTLTEGNLQEVLTAGRRARDLVKQILAFARKSSETLKPLRVDRIADEVLRLIRSTIPTTVEIRQHLDSDSLVKGNASQLHQVLINLCTNAAQAMEKTGGVLDVRLVDVAIDSGDAPARFGLKSGGYIKLSVSDTGTGIAPHVLSAIFEPYFTTKRSGEGTGMGLAVVEGIVESYGGKIVVESRSGKGSEFTVYLPIAQKCTNPEPHEFQPPVLGSERILIIDDEPAVANVGARVLEHLGYKVTAKTRSLDALDLFRAHPDEFDLVLTDMTMPDMTGCDLAAALLAIRPELPIILSTGYSKTVSEGSIADFGVKAIVYKPIVMVELARVVRQVLDKG